ncbi:MAG: hypothetical protein R3176_07790 [Woeseiaceae bacterium]|nr:hypothetical protein [Woeseiaceae bacterium]
MIVSHEKKFIFVKTRKTSGTSMEIALSQICGPDDIITPISFEDELVRLDMGGRLPQNYGGRGEARYREMIRNRKLKLIRARRRGRFYNHMPAVKIREHLGRETWDEYFKFTIERHPYEKVVSHVYFHARRRKRWDFDTEVKRVLERGYYINFPVYCEGNRPIVDFIVNFERRAEDLATLSEKLGFDVAARHPETKHRFRADRQPARELLSDEVKERIYASCRVEFEALGFAR